MKVEELAGISQDQLDYSKFERGVNSFKEIYQFLKPYKLQLFGVLIALIFTSSSILAIGKAIEYIIDSGFSGNNPALLDKSLLILLMFAILLAIATYTRASLIYYICENIVADIRNNVYKKVIRLSPAFFEVNKTSDILSRLTNDTTLLNGIIATIVSISLRNLLLFLGGFVMLVYTSPKLTLVVLILVPLIITPIMYLGRKVRKLSKLSQEKLSNLSAHIDESLNGIKTVQAYTREKFEINLFKLNVEDNLNTSLKRVRYRSLLIAIVISSIFIAIGCVLWLGGKDVLSGKMTGGTLSSFIFYSIILASSVGALSEVFGDVQRAIGATERLFELLNLEPDIIDPINPLTIEQNNLNIDFKNVTFYYPTRKDNPSLQNINFNIKPGEKIALVGESGAGKSTIIQLLLRYYDFDLGKIEISSIDIKKLSLRDLRSLFAIVPQDPIIFSTTAFENIKYGNPDADDNDVIEAAKKAEIYEFLQSLPDGINTFLGEKGVRISGGQAQRIAIARAILKNPSILLLDEATSSLDTQNEKKVQKALDNLMKNRTTIIIAHRLSTIKNADRIIVLDKGLIVESGTHTYLMKCKGHYFNLIKNQRDI